LSEHELFSEINKVLHTYQPHEVFYPLKAYGVRYIRPPSMKVTLACVVLDYMRLPVTIRLIVGITGLPYPSTSSIMARLGDKNVLNLKGYDKNKLSYEVHPDFKSHLKLDFTEVDKFVSRWNAEHGN